MKATHKGQCQCCGNIQKLPNGMLSTHGYTVQHGWFSGTCLGSRHKPFEESCDLLKQCIDDTKSSLKGMNKELTELQSETDYIWASYKYTGSNGYARTITRKTSLADISEIDGNFYVTERIWNKDVKMCINNYIFKPTLEQLIKQGNENRSHKVRAQIAQAESYIEWQNERLQNWKSSEVTAI